MFALMFSFQSGMVILSSLVMRMLGFSSNLIVNSHFTRQSRSIPLSVNLRSMVSNSLNFSTVFSPWSEYFLRQFVFHPPKVKYLEQRRIGDARADVALTAEMPNLSSIPPCMVKEYPPAIANTPGVRILIAFSSIGSL